MSGVATEGKKGERMDTISDSVGLNGINKPADARTVQRLLNQNHGRMPGSREIPVDGIVGPKTIAAISAFQEKVMKWKHPDGCVDPDGKTFKALVAGSEQAKGGHPDPAPAPMAAPGLEKPICFPLRTRNVPDYHVPADLSRAHHHRYFGAQRTKKDGGYRAHAACDLVVAPETVVYAVDDGIVDHYEPGFFDVTGALVVRHANGLVVRYGELSRAVAGLNAGTEVTRGNPVGYVGENSFGSSMLHIEFYAGTLKGSLSMAGNLFQRRGDLVNPTDYLDAAAVDAR